MAISGHPWPSVAIKHLLDVHVPLAIVHVAVRVREYARAVPGTLMEPPVVGRAVIVHLLTLAVLLIVEPLTLVYGAEDVPELAAPLLAPVHVLALVHAVARIDEGRFPATLVNTCDAGTRALARILARLARRLHARDGGP